MDEDCPDARLCETGICAEPVVLTQAMEIAIPIISVGRACVPSCQTDAARVAKAVAKMDVASNLWPAKTILTVSPIASAASLYWPTRA